MLIIIFIALTIMITTFRRNENKLGQSGSIKKVAGNVLTYSHKLKCTKNCIYLSSYICIVFGASDSLFRLTFISNAH